MIITAKEYHARFLADAKSILQRTQFTESGGPHSGGVFPSVYTLSVACERGYMLAIAYAISGESAYRDCCRRLLDYCRRLLVEVDGRRYWPRETVSLCDQGRTLRCLLHAAALTEDREAYAWLADVLARWPYDEARHCFVERFSAATHDPTALYGPHYVYNMVAEGGADACLAGYLAGDAALMAKGWDTIENYVLVGQNPDGTWNYHSPRPMDMGKLNDGEDEYNYNLYLLNILSALLEIPSMREKVAPPLARSFDVLYERFALGDGSMYAPVHWGWDHLWECTLYAALIGWRLYHYCGMERYSAISARALDWLRRADLGVGNLHSCNMTTCGMFWGTYFLDMFKDDFSVSFAGEPATDAQIIATLDRTEKILRVPPADDTHLNFYFSIYGCNTAPAIRRKINRMKYHPEHAVADIPSVGGGEVTLSLPWDDPVNCAAGEVQISRCEQGLRLRVRCEREMTNQPYHGPTLFRGDNILLELRDGGAVTKISLALEDGVPVVYRYSNDFRLGDDLRCYKRNIPRGWYGEKSLLAVEIADGVTVFDALLHRDELGDVVPESGKPLPAGIAIVCHTAYGCQFNQWGKTTLESRPLPYDGKWNLM